MEANPPQTITSSSFRRDSLLRIPIVLILLCAFFLSWGPGTQGAIHINPSKIFAALAFLVILCWILSATHRSRFASWVAYIDSSKTFIALCSLLVLHWLLCVRDRLRAMPRAVTWFLLYFLLHTFVTYFVVHPDPSRVDRIVEAYTGESWLAGFNRVMLFAVFAYALATYVKTDRQLQAMAFFMGAGLLITLLIGAQDLYTSRSDLRNVGGFTNPNYFASVAVTAFFLNLVAWVKVGNSVRGRIFTGSFILVSLVACLASGSRGALLGLIAGLLVMLCYTRGPSRRIRNTVVLAFLIMLAVLLIPVANTEMLQTRLSIERFVGDSTSGRLHIWAAYIMRISRYFLTGVGYGRSCTVMVGALPLPRPPHNQYLAVLVDLGIVGLLLFMLGLWQVWKSLRYPSRQIGSWKIDAIYRGFFVAWLFLLSTGTRGTNRAWWLSLGVIVAYGRVKKMRVTHRQLGDGVNIASNS